MTESLYARGKEKDGEMRGTSMVEKHLQKLQQEKEEEANVKLQVLMPQFGQKVRNAALGETDWIPEKAALLLRRFHVANASRLSHLHKKRKRILSALVKSAGGRSGHHVDGLVESSDQGTGDSDRDSSDGSRKRSKRHSRKHKSKKSKKSKKKSDKEKHSSAASFGKHGVIRESDYHSKRAEFVKWALDTKRIDTESLNKADEMKLFADFAEDYNTGTLPHVKYYDLEAYHKKKTAERSSSKRRATDAYRFNDEEEMRKEKERRRMEDHKRRIQEAYYELKTSEKATDMKQQELLRMQMKLAYKTGDTHTVDKLAERLKPDDPNDPTKLDLPDEEW